VEVKTELWKGNKESVVRKRMLEMGVPLERINEKETEP